MSKAQSDYLQIEYRSPRELKPHSHNAKIHSKQQILKLAKSIKRFGWVLISDQNEIIAGFALYDRDLLAIQLEELTNLGFDEIDVTGFSLSDDIRLGETAEKKRAVGPDDDLPAPRKIIVSCRG